MCRGQTNRQTFLLDILKIFRDKLSLPKGDQIVLCHVCAENPMTKDQKSIAAGNNYGQLGYLKPLNGTTRNACVPVQLYNIYLQIRDHHSTNHGVAFPMNGPVECLKNFPCVDEKLYATGTNSQLVLFKQHTGVRLLAAAAM
jgi:hypothetical protein